MILEGLAELLAGMQRLDTAWMLGGSVGAMCYSEPRATLDVDCILALSPGQEQRVIAAFDAAWFYLPPESVLRHELRRGAAGSFNIIHHGSGFKADCYPCGDDDLMRWGLAHARPMPLAGMMIPVAPPEYIVAMKLRYFAISGQDKHLRDIRSIIRLLPGLDTVAVAAWSARYGTAAAWALCRDTADGSAPHD
jgi:hypothetical protein